MTFSQRFKAMLHEFIQDCKRHKKLLLVVCLLALMNLLRMLGL